MAEIGGVWYFVAIAAASVILALLTLVSFAFFDRRRLGPEANDDQIAFLFDQDQLVDASKAGWAILHALEDKRAKEPGEEGDTDQDSTRIHDWRVLARGLRGRFPRLPALADEALAMAPASVPSVLRDDSARLLIEAPRGLLRVTIEDESSASSGDRHIALTAAQELKILNSVSHLYPNPVWLRGGDGSLLWANRAMRDLAGADGAQAFCDKLTDDEPIRQPTQRNRILLENAEGETHWHEVVRARSEDGIELGFAMDVDAVVVAESNQRKFVQTLSKTFAQLSTGLAIFDRHQQLQLFNPALLDLLSLPGDFLSARPTLLTFFDKLRENQMMPEPKNYSGWRQQIAELVSASTDGHYRETWTLPTGLTYRVTGRPHPDGAIALLFEDISAEISLTRRFRAQLNLGQSIIDSLDEGIAVFSARGILSGSNAAFRAMWKMDPESSFADVTIDDARRQWQSMMKKTPFWNKLHRFVFSRGQREEWFADVETCDGQRMECRVTPLPGGATLVGFRLPPLVASTLDSVAHTTVEGEKSA